MKIDDGVRFGDRAGELAQRLAHQPRLQAGQLIAHLAFQFGLGRQRRHRIDHHDVDAAGAHQRVGDLQRLFAGVGLGDQHLVDVDAQLLGIDRIERMFGVDIGGDAALLLGLGHDMQRQRGLARGFRAVDLDDAAARQAADAQRDVEAQRAGRNRVGRRPPIALASFITEPLPNARSIWDSAASSARLRSLFSSLPTTRKAACAHRFISLFHSAPQIPSGSGASQCTCFVPARNSGGKSLVAKCFRETVLVLFETQ